MLLKINDEKKLYGVKVIMKKSILSVFILLCFASCSQNLLDSPAKPSKKSASSRNVTSVSLDSSFYKDVTLSNINAKLLTKYDFASVSEGTFYNGKSYINVDFNKGFVTLFTPQSSSKEIYGKSFKVSFNYEIKAADQNTLYLCPSSFSNLKCFVNGQEISANQISNLNFIIPLYGYGKSRLEVSSVMNGFNAMPFGTYWKN